MKFFKVLIIGGFAALVTNALASADGSGSHGGHYVDVGSRAALRDLVDKTACHWVGGPTFIQNHVPGYKAFYDQLESAHWYFADAFRREVNKVQFCETRGNLKRIPVEDQDGLTIYEEKSKQLATRLNDQVFMDMNAFDRLLNNDHQTFTFVHEIMHSFIPFDAPRRNDSLRSIIAMLNSGMNSTVLSTIIENNHIDMPPTTIDIDAAKSEILTAVNPNAPLAKRLSLVKKVTFFKDHLWSQDRDLFEGGLDRLRDQAHEKIRAAIEFGQLNELMKIYEETEFNPNEGIEYSDGFIGHTHSQYGPRGLELREGWVVGDGQYASGLAYASRYAQPEAVKWFLSRPGIDVNFSRPLAEAIISVCNQVKYHMPQGIDGNWRDRYMEIISLLSQDPRTDVNYSIKLSKPYMDSETLAEVQSRVSKRALK